jgi:hypothetical protein
MVMVGSSCMPAGPWQDDDAKAYYDDARALFNPKLEFYNIVAFMIMNFIEIFLTRRKYG